MISTAKIISGLALATSVCAVAAKKTAGEEYGVGINLSFDYGTISVQYPNRSIVDIATVNGNPAYRHVLLNNVAVSTHDLEQQFPSETLDIEAHISEQTSFLDQIRQLWRSRSREDDAVKLMYRALKAAGESYIGNEITKAVVTLPYDFDEDFQRQLEASASAAHIQAMFLPSHPAAQVASFAYGQGRGRRGPDQEYVTLAIDYNEACLSALITHDGDGISERYKTIYNTTLGARNKPTYDDLYAAMQQLGGAIPDHLDCPAISLALSGAAAGDRTMKAALKRSLKRYYDGCRSSAGEDAPDMDVDPLYAASRGGAEICAMQMTDQNALDL